MLALVFLNVRAWSRGWVYCTTQTLFGLYLLAVIGEMFFPIPYPENWPANLSWETTIQSLSQVNLIPFNFGTLFAPWTSPRTIIREIAGNIILTIPFGFGIWFLRPFHKKAVFPTALIVGLALEGTQLIMQLIIGFSLHAVDINDVILNGLGVALGSWIYHCQNAVKRK